MCVHVYVMDDDFVLLIIDEGAIYESFQSCKGNDSHLLNQKNRVYLIMPFKYKPLNYP